MHMHRLEKWGGIGALVAAGTFVVGLAMFATVLTDFTSATDPAEALRFLIDDRQAVYVWNLIVTVVFGVAIVPLALALGRRLDASSRPIARVATVFGVIWSGLLLATGMILNVGYGVVIDLHATDPEQAATVWSAIDSVATGLGGGNEIVGGIWVLLVSITALRTGLIGRVLGLLGVAAGIAGLVTVVPGLEPVGAVFGLGLIVWFVGVGRALLRSGASPGEVDEPTRAGTRAGVPSSV